MSPISLKKMWSKQQIEFHKTAAQILCKIKDLTIDYIEESKKISEFDVQQFILKKFKEFGLKTDKNPPIVAFAKNTSKVHYFPNKKSNYLKNRDLILLDLWGKLKYSKAPFADITWMAYKGDHIPNEIQQIWNVVLKVRKQSILRIKRWIKSGSIPSGNEINQMTRKIMNQNGFGEIDNYYTGHSLGVSSAHGKKANISLSNKKSLSKNQGYTIEPGIYIKNKFGVRSEVNFFISNNNEIILTTSLQNKITKL